MLWMLAPGSAMAAFPALTFSAKAVEIEGVMIQDVRGYLQQDGRYDVSGKRAEMTGYSTVITDISIRGQIHDDTNFSGNIQFNTARYPHILEANYDLNTTPDGVRGQLRFARQDVLRITKIPDLPAQARWLKRGELETKVDYRQVKGEPAVLKAVLAVKDLGFDSPDGRFASESLVAVAEVTVTPGRWNALKVEGLIKSGEILVDNFYRNFSKGELQFAFESSLNDDRLHIQPFSITDHTSVTIGGSASFDTGDNPESWRLEISRLDLQFPGAYDRYVEPMAAALTLDGLEVTGAVSWNGQWDAGKFTSGDLRVNDLSIVDTRRKRFAFTGLEARMRPGDHAFDSRLRWRGLLIGRINLGIGEVALDSEPGTFTIVDPVELDVLGGRLILSKLAVLLPGRAGNDASEPDIRLKADLENLDMERVTAALDWPSFSGKVSGHIPGVSLNDGVIDVEGEILVSVFDGTLALTDLRIERPFGVLPSLAGNIEAQGLDLQELTRTFSFGQISGRLDGYVRDLRMLDWKPVAFDAWFGTPEQQKGSRDISRKAVNHLTTLGGGRATTALTSPVMKLFNSFSYKALGLGCRMQDNVCEIRGVSEDETSVLIMEGAGVPKVTIRAFNRRVDWPQLMSQLLATSEGESVKIGD